MLINTEGGYWTNTNNARRFFDDYASANGFDPLITENWYSISTKDIENQKVWLDYAVFNSSYYVGR